MGHILPISYKIADSKEEMEQIYRLNYETFVEEIPQHKVNTERRLVDRFHDENIYVIAKKEDEVIGMITVRGNRPFSLDQKLNNLDHYLPENAKPCEIRLLSIKREYRGGRVFYELCKRLVLYCVEQGYTIAIISGTTRQLKLYKHIGFRPFGPLVGTKQAAYQPMYLTKENFESASKLFQRLLERAEKRKRNDKIEEINFLPGPVPICKTVQEAWEKPAISHRSADFQHVFQHVQQALCELTGANYVEIAVGTGTLANDMVAAQLSVMDSKGLILANGEFGERLIDHGKSWNLSFEKIQKQWNTPILIEEIEEMLQGNPDINWLWTVHCETSTGYVYPLAALKEVCEKYHVHLCIDACSTIGVIPTDLTNVYLASSVSGKGLGSYPGIAIVFHEQPIFPNRRIPNYLDLGRYQAATTVPFTHSSNGMFALEVALKQLTYASETLANEICEELMDAGMTVLRGESYSPGIITIELPSEMSSREFGDQLKKAGILLSYESSYLLERNWVQIALMGELNQKRIIRAMKEIKVRFIKFNKRKASTI